MISTFPETNIEFDLQTTQTKLILKAPRLSEQINFNVIYYTDVYKYEKIQNLQVSLLGYQGLHMHTVINKWVGSQLILPSDVQRLANLYSSGPNVKFVAPYDKEFLIVPGKLNIIPI